MGYWYRPRGQRPGRTEGQLNFSIIKGLYKRQVPSVLAVGAEEDSPLARYDIPRPDRQPLKKWRRFARALAKHTDHLIEGDGLIIHGLREEDLQEHFHTLLILRTDPLTGMPIRVADNAGRPKIRTLAMAMRNAPRRSIKYRIRVDFEAYHRLARRIAVAQQALAESSY